MKKTNLVFTLLSLFWILDNRFVLAESHLSIAAKKPRRTAPNVVALQCSDIFTKLGIEDLFHEQDKLRSALEIVLKKHQKGKIPIPKLDEAIGITAAKGQKEFAVKAKDLKIGENLKVPETSIHDVTPGQDIGEGLRNVLQVSTGNKTYYFRPLRGSGKGNPNQGDFARKTMAASILNQALSLTTVPHTKWASVNGELGALSDEAPGDLLSEGIRQYKSSVYLPALAEANPKNHSDVAAFEFLAGNRDGVSNNMMVDSKSDFAVKVFDHDGAFVAGLVRVKNSKKKANAEAVEDPSKLLAGPFLPEKYSQEFATALEALTPKIIEKKLSPFLSAEEIAGVVFRREIMLQDMKTRGENAVLKN